MRPERTTYSISQGNALAYHNIIHLRPERATLSIKSFSQNSKKQLNSHFFKLIRPERTTYSISQGSALADHNVIHQRPERATLSIKSISQNPKQQLDSHLFKLIRPERTTYFTSQGSALAHSYVIHLRPERATFFNKIDLSKQNNS